MLSNRPTKLRILALAICAALVLTWNVQSRWSEGNIKIEPSGVTDISLPPRPSCKHLPGAEDALIIFKTGSTELKDRLPIHLNTTLQCYPNYIIFSDFGERFDNEHIIDALEFVSTDIQSHHDDFKLWRRLQQGGRAIFETSELSGPDSEAIEAVGKPKNPGWKLDKWKFLPMVKRTLDNYPSMKWYVFVEADTYLLWASLLQYLAFLDHTQHYYIGSQTYIGDTLFAHGGTGFIVSQPAMRMVVARYNARQQEIESYTDAHWAGDCVLGKVFKDAGVKFTSAWPILQGDYPGLVPYARPDGRPIADSSMREWCYPVVSYHHMSPTDIRDMWNFEQEWLGSDRTGQEPFLRHKDVFKQYILPRMNRPREDWDNQSGNDEGRVNSLEECRARCEEVMDCKQYSIDKKSHCRTRVDPCLGKIGVGVKSGWLYDRMLQFVQNMAPCGDEGWLT